MPPLGAKCPAYDSNGRIWRRTRPNPTPGGPAAAAKPRRFARAPLAQKNQLVRRQRSQPRPLLPDTTRTLAYTHASTAAAATRAAIT